MSAKKETTMESKEIMTLTFFKNWHEIAKKYNLSKEQYGEVIYAMCEYCFYGIDSELEEKGGLIFEMAKPSIDKSSRNKIEGSAGGIKARGKSGAPEGNQNASKKKAR